MSFLIFAYRKLVLKRQIGDGQFRQMVLSQQKQTMAEQIGQLQQSISAAKNIFSVLANGTMATISQQVNAKYANGVTSDDQQRSIMQEIGSQQYSVMQRLNQSNSVFEAASTAQMSQIKSKESQIDSEMANLESRLKLLSGELESVEKGETEAAKSEAPKFGLG